MSIFVQIIYLNADKVIHRARSVPMIVPANKLLDAINAGQFIVTGVHVRTILRDNGTDIGKCI
jgi:hypothetical protein